MNLRPKVVVLLLLIYFLMYFPLFVGVLDLSLFCYILLCVHFSFAIIFTRKIKPVALLLLSCRCVVSINVLWLFLTVPWVGLQYVVAVFPDHAHLLFKSSEWTIKKVNWSFVNKRTWHFPAIHMPPSLFPQTVPFATID